MPGLCVYLVNLIYYFLHTAYGDVGILFYSTISVLWTDAGAPRVSLCLYNDSKYYSIILYILFYYLKPKSTMNNPPETHTPQQLIQGGFLAAAHPDKKRRMGMLERWEWSLMDTTSCMWRIWSQQSDKAVPVPKVRATVNSFSPKEIILENISFRISSSNMGKAKVYFFPFYGEP